MHGPLAKVVLGMVLASAALWGAIVPQNDLGHWLIRAVGGSGNSPSAFQAGLPGRKLRGRIHNDTKFDDVLRPWSEALSRVGR
jgi:hypothetical protein